MLKRSAGNKIRLTEKRPEQNQTSSVLMKNFRNCMFEGYAAKESVIQSLFKQQYTFYMGF